MLLGGVVCVSFLGGAVCVLILGRSGVCVLFFGRRRVCVFVLGGRGVCVCLGRQGVCVSWGRGCLLFVLETIRTGTMRVIQITVKTEETQILRIKFVLVLSYLNQTHLSTVCTVLSYLC